MQMKITSRTPLILEGGGMRGVFTSGVLDAFMEHDIRFPYVIGVSAGASNGLSYMSWQHKRARYSNIELLDKYHYVGLKYLFTQGNIMDYDLLFNYFPKKIIPYDYVAYERNPARFIAITTNCRTGKPYYMEERHDEERILTMARATCSLPFFCPIVWLDGEPLLDGGITDSIPLQHALDEGYDETPVVVLTRNKGYRKPERTYTVPSIFYRKYPLLRKAIGMRNLMYNKQIELVERLESEGRIIVIRPQQPIQVRRIETDTRKLIDLYEEGRAEVKKLL